MPDLYNSKISASLIAPKLSDELWEIIIPHSTRTVFKAGSMIYSQDNPSHYMFCIESGMVKLSHLLDDGFESVVSLYSKDNIFGELSAFSTEALNPMAVAISDTVARVISADTARMLIKQDYHFSEFICMSLLQKLNCITRQMYLVAGKSVFSRIACVLPILYAYGYSYDNEGWYTITHAEFAALIGTTRSQVTTYLNQLENEGLIKLRRNQIKIIDSEKVKLYGYTKAD